MTSVRSPVQWTAVPPPGGFREGQSSHDRAARADRLGEDLERDRLPGFVAVRVISTFRLPVRNESFGLSFHAALSGVASETWASGRQFARKPASESLAATSATGRRERLVAFKMDHVCSGRVAALPQLYRALHGS